jgi:hypothetical protein
VEARRTTTDTAGTYRFDGLSSGSLKLSFLAQRSMRAQRDITPQDRSATLGLELQVSGIGTLIEVSAFAGTPNASRMPAADRELPKQVTSMMQVRNEAA